VRLKLANLSEFIRDIKVTFARYYNSRHNSRGYFWRDRFKSVIVDRGETIVNCLAYIDLNPRILAKQKNKNFEITKASRMRHRTRYLTDSGIIGSKEFVSTHYQRFKHLFATKNKKTPKPVKGLSGIYSLKQLSQLL
jgi:hypothetical protein